MRSSFTGRLRHVAWIVALGAAGAAVIPRRADPESDRRSALAHALEKRGIVTTPEDCDWLERPGAPLGGAARAIVRGAPSRGEPNDIFVVETRLSPEGVLLAVGSAFNLTETSSADEARPVIRGERIAYVTHPLLAEVASTVHVIDLAGQPPQATAGWTRLERVQNALTNAQATGQLRGVVKRTFAVEAEEKKGEADPTKAEPAKTEATRDVSVELASGMLTIRAGARVATLALDKAGTVPGWIRTESPELSRPGNLATWAVDRVRNEVGDDAMQTVKAVAFTALDFVLRNKESVTGDTGAEGIAKDLGTNELEPAVRSIPADPEIGWPPAPLEPWVVPALGGEGQWNPLDKDPYVRKNEGLPPAFLTTFIRTDRTRKATRVYVALWDPRQVELHMMAGTVEPKGATGEAGPGLIPRTPEVLKRVVAASNAGFQALHGEFGMMADGVVYLPPKPYAATVSVLRDGSTGFGTWPQDTSIPETILSYRQNMTVMVEDEKFNPYNRTWWGGTPPGWADKTHTVRTGICLTKERFVAYFYGADLSPEALAQAMIQTRCSFGLALDMNAGHSGLEFYKVAPAEEFEPLKQPLQFDWQHEGEVPGLNGWKFRARRLIRGMGLMNFPRYIKKESRDYFYMTLRHVLPGPALVPVVQKTPLAGEGEWRLKGLPQHGFPYAVALTEIRPDGARADLKARVLQIDPRMVNAEPAGKGKSSKTVAIVDAGDKPAGEVPSLWHSAGAFSIGAQPPVPEAVRIASGEAGQAAPAAAAVGVSDDGGMLFYIEIENPPAQLSAADGKLLNEYLKKLGCSSRLLLPKALPVALGGDSDWAGNPVHPPSGAGAVRLARAEGAGGRRVFQDTPVVPFDVWYPLQQKRIRYFKKPQGAEEAN
ncbi:Cobalt-zinc-cadmium resistance protein [Minicystis rosea]|nr:Cobalt-zinc-cadmium resistance protein [Minicystis rosea]